VESIFYKELSNGQTVNVFSVGRDTDYAHDCFDGSDREWQELISDAGENPTFYLASLGMPGYLADSVSVSTSRKDAIESAKFWIEQDEEMLAEESE
jgi:hypothetical protein